MSIYNIKMNRQTNLKTGIDMKTKINVTIVNNQKKIDCEAGISVNELLQYIDKAHHIAA